MAFWRQLSRGLRALVDREAADRDLDDEMRHYLDEATDAYAERGLPRADARAAAHREIGDPVRIREQVRDSGWERAATH